MDAEPSPPPELPCGGKLRFNSQAEARSAAAAIEHQRGIKLKAYKCRHCRLWHLSTSYTG